MLTPRSSERTALTLLIALCTPVAFAGDSPTRSAVSPQVKARVVKARPKVPPLPADVTARGDRLWGEASPAVRDWVSQVAPGITKGSGEPHALAQTAVRSRWSHVRIGGASEALDFLVLYRADIILRKDIDSLSEMGEMESLRLQMAMDRQSKIMSTLSNLLRKLSDTSDAIVQKMK
jgi:hypothetical protein